MIAYNFNKVECFNLGGGDVLKTRRSALRAMLNDSDRGVRQAAATALDAVEAVADLDQLFAVLRNGERGQRIAAAFALERVNAPRVFPVLLELLKSDDPDLRLVAVTVLGEKKHPKTVAALVKMLDDPENGVQAEAARVLGGFSDRSLPESLAPLLQRDESVALAAVIAIGKLKFAEGESVLLTALRDKRSTVRAKAAEMLGKLES